MYNRIKQFLQFLFPIIGTAVLQVTADALTDKAYTNGRRLPRGRYTAYTRPPRRPSSESFRTNSVGETDVMIERERINRIRREQAQQGVFRDVLMVAFDLTGPSASIAQEWLMNNLPMTGDHLARGNNDESVNVNLDAWWIANDERFDGSDTDSAVFVKKGKQTEARALLKRHGLSW